MNPTHPATTPATPTTNARHPTPPELGSALERAAEAHAFDVGGWLLSLYPIDLLGDEAAPDAPTPKAGWNGVTFAINVQSEVDLRAMFDAAVVAGATLVAPVSRREWGGMSGYVADPEGNRWELAVGSEFV